MKIYTLLLMTMLVVTGCDDYLSENPSRGSNEPLNNSAQVEALFNNSELLVTTALGAAFSSDDVEFTTSMYDMASYNFDTDLPPYYVWGIEGIENGSEDVLWTEQYKKIFLANLIINEIDEVNDLTESDRTEFLAHAHFLRATAYWQLVNIYCMPYAEENLQLPGLTLKQTTSYEESMVRASLADTYDFIEQDLQEALKTNATDIEQRWRVSRPAVQAMLARFYLFTGNYAEAEEYAEEALQSQNATLQDMNELGYSYGSIWNSWGEEVSVDYPEYYNYSALQYTDFQEMSILRCTDFTQ